MGFVLTESSSVTCGSQGTVQTTGKAKLKVANAKVLTLTGITGKSISGCTTPNSSGSKQCTTVSSASGEATKLKVSGEAVVILPFTGSSDGTVPTLSATANQSKLKAS